MQSQLPDIVRGGSAGETNYDESTIDSMVGIVGINNVE